MRGISPVNKHKRKLISICVLMACCFVLVVVYQEGVRAFQQSDHGDYEQAIAEYTKAIESNPNDIYAYIIRGNAYKSLGD